METTLLRHEFPWYQGGLQGSDFRINIIELLEQHAVVVKHIDDLRLNFALYLPHELQTPLNAILGFSHYVMSLDSERLPEADEILSIHTAIYESALRLQRLIENYLLYANLRLMEIDPERSRRDLWQSDDWLTTAAVITPIARSKAEKDQRQEDLRLELVDADVRLSRKSLQKIVDELIDNALKFSEPGTPVHLTTTVDSHHWMLRVSDQGRGMTAGQIANIEAFMQFERKRYEQQGSGFGLIIVRLLAQMNGGEFTIESVPKEGTSVTVVLNRKV